MSDETTEAQGAPDSSDAGPSPATQETGAADVRALQAQIEEYQQRVKKLSDEAAKYRNARKDEERQKLEAAKKAGELEPVVKDLEARLAEREKLAAFGEREMQRLQERVERETAKLPPEVRARIERFSDVETRAEALDIYLAAAGTKRPTSPVPPEGAPAGAVPPSPSFNGLSGDALLAAIQRDPTAYWEAQGVSAKPRTFLGRALGARK